ncbi:PTS sugar transporter subunit IIA [Paratissierella segnis]|jgi:mannose/fructose-specific phosphotransferase system component IIA|uniref:PTS EIIA type-4 domain-containing protein n=1 Tax=Paratissierella segnis TaxID=2763679 RepID=A0A926EV02_9FIRM|nr:hypothetical protein [Paratissierella segnis]MBC8587062.1 hypothetical protein [Paratissierella segnis]
MRKIFDEQNINPHVPGIIILTHGPLAISLVESVEMLCLKVENLAAFSLDENDAPEYYHDEFIKALNAFPKSSIVLLDLFGGTPCNQLVVHMKKNEATCLALTGVNMPILVEAISLRGMYKGNGLLKELKKIGNEGIVNINELLLD